jgi:SulP family sulfate permease
MDDPEIDQPGLGTLRSAVANFARKGLPDAGLAREATAGLTVTVGSVPDGMANGLLAGVNPIYGLYANMVAPIAGGALSSSRPMVINSTSAAALVAGQALLATPPDKRADALFLLVVLAGVFQFLFGVLKLGRLTRFISFSVMTGFVAGIAVVLVLSQLPTVTGYDAEGGNSVATTADLAGHLGSIHLATLLLAVATIVLGIGLRRTPLKKLATLLALAVPTIVVAVAGLDNVAVVGDIGTINGGFPLPSLPSLSGLSGTVVTGAIAVAIVTLVQGAGISQSIPRPDGGRASTSRDFVAQGAGNIASGLFRGLPVGGSLTGTVLNLSSGGKGRRAVILSGVWMMVVVLAFSGVVTAVAMPALGALLILVSVNSIKSDDIAQVWRAGWPARIGAAITFGCTLLLPIQAAVAIGVVLAGVLHIATESTDISIVQLVKRPDGSVEERPPPDRLQGHSATVLDIYGSLFYAGARTLERRLPRPDGEGPVVVLRLRGRAPLGATIVDVLANYAERLGAAGGRLYLSGLSQEARAQLLSNDRFRDGDGVEVYEATTVVGESTNRASADADEWLIAQRDSYPPRNREA